RLRDSDRNRWRTEFQTVVVGMKNSTDDATAAVALSEQELQRLVEYFSILRDWSLQHNKLKDRDDDTSALQAITSVDGSKVRQRAPESATGERRSPAGVG
ncbi:MAG TPA: hypothetical protein VMM77_06150, partial [Gemmatimonadaceae bacterium]|nr:hypothetical protein [Gemmatimonadaceae bacterium]